MILTGEEVLIIERESILKQRLVELFKVEPWQSNWKDAGKSSTTCKIIV
jgi:hypothetical protein